MNAGQRIAQLRYQIRSIRTKPNKRVLETQKTIYLTFNYSIKIFNYDKVVLLKIR